MSKTARHIWRSARQNQLPTLPPCPDDLSEPRYIALLFSNVCQVCGANRGQRTHFTLRTRHCASCYKTHVVSIKSLIWEKTLGHLDCRELQQLLWVVPGESTSQGYAFNFRQLEKYLKEYRALKSDKLQGEYIATLKESTKKVREHAQTVFCWLEKQQRLKIQQEDEMSEARWKRIQKKLHELGWKKEDFPPMYHSQWTKLTRKPQVLTDKVWTNLYPKLESMLQHYRSMRLELERLDRREWLRMSVIE
ncbi:hypothetical protein FRC03_004312 [Tulasnella sp. 419]|nr:hypothetical protein FRC03_004312 [Tulasnella sp. 419]